MRSFVALPFLVLSVARFESVEAGAAVAPAAAAVRTEVNVRLDPAAHRLAATASVDLRAPAASESFEISSKLLIEDVQVDGRTSSYDTAPIDGKLGMARLTVHVLPERPGPRRITIRYSGELYDPPQVAQFSRDRIADQTQGTIQPEGVFLAPEAGWYPKATSAPAMFRTEIRVPAEWDAVAEGSLEVRESDAKGMRIVYSATHPTEGLHLVAGPWRRVEVDHGGVKVAAYVVPDDVALGETYVAAVGRYLDMYSAWFGPYPYDRFAVVENFFSTGYGMAGFTVLGRDVMRLPFIVDTSLGHEVAHSWWGNGVFVDENGGNWSEGLTSYVADHHYKRLQSEAAGAEYRRETCREFTNYVAESGKDFPLTEFTERTTANTRAIGYGKTLMVFRMLEERLGKDKFDRALQRFYRDNLYRRASWSTIQSVFSREAGENLNWFFDQWVARPGAPSLSLQGFRVGEPGPDGSIPVEGTVVQAGGTWRLAFPLVFEGGGRNERRLIEVRDARTKVSVTLPFRPQVVRGDPDQDVFRRLDAEEIPPILSRVLGDSKALFVVHDGAGAESVAAYRAIAETLTRSGMGEIVDASAVKAESAKGRSVFFLGLPPAGALRDLLRELPSEVVLREDGLRVEGKDYAEPGAAALAVGRRPGDPTRAVAIFHGLNEAGIREAGRKLVHYGKYSYLAFVDGKNVAKGVARFDGGPLVVRF